MPFESFVIDGVPEASRRLDGPHWWNALERAIPQGVQPIVSGLPSRAPRRSGRLAQHGFDLQLRRRLGEGLVNGVEAAIGAREPYAHLVERGHRIIPRGPSRTGHLTRARRSELRSGLKARRAAGGAGSVRGRPFAEPFAAQLWPTVVARIEALMGAMATQ